jgi:hypothetical protein
MPAVLLDAAGRPRSPATLPGFHTVVRHGTKASATRLTRAPSPRSWPSCDTPGAACTRRGSVRSSSCCGAPGCASTKPSPSAKPTSIRAAARCSCGAARAVAAARSAWTTGPGSSFSPGLRRAWTYPSVRSSASLPGRHAVVRGRPAPHGNELRHAAARADVRRRFAPHQLRYAHAVEMAREGVPLIVIQRQLGHTNLGITSIYLQGIDSTEIIDTVHARRPPMVPVDVTLQL